MAGGGDWDGFFVCRSAAGGGKGGGVSVRRGTVAGHADGDFLCVVGCGFAAAGEGGARVV